LKILKLKFQLNLQLKIESFFKPTKNRLTSRSCFESMLGSVLVTKMQPAVGDPASAGGLD